MPHCALFIGCLTDSLRFGLLPWRNTNIAPRRFTSVAGSWKSPTAVVHVTHGNALNSSWLNLGELFQRSTSEGQQINISTGSISKYTFEVDGQ